MKNFIIACFATLVVMLLPVFSPAQNIGGNSSSSNPCYNIASKGSCVCRPDGKLRNWLSQLILQKAKTQLDQCGGKCKPLNQYMEMYYRSNSLHIDYLGGNWQKGLSFRVISGGGDVIIDLEDI